MNYTVACELYEMMMNTSVVKKLIEKNKRLKLENNSLKNLINSIPEFRCKCSENHPPNLSDDRRSSTKLVVGTFGP